MDIGRMEPFGIQPCRVRWWPACPALFVLSLSLLPGIQAQASENDTLDSAAPRVPSFLQEFQEPCPVLHHPVPEVLVPSRHLRRLLRLQMPLAENRHAPPSSHHTTRRNTEHAIHLWGAEVCHVTGNRTSWLYPFLCSFLFICLFVLQVVYKRSSKPVMKFILKECFQKYLNAKTNKYS